MNVRYPVAVLAALAVVVAGVAAPGASAQIPRPSVERVCPAPKPGSVSCGALRVAHGGAAPNVTVNGFGATDIESAYNLPAGAGAGRTVAVVDAMNDPTAESDLAVYRTQYGLPACTTANGCFKKVNQNGLASPLPPYDAGWAQEIALDLDMVSAACPACKILLVEGSLSETSLGTGVNTAVTLGAVAVSNSWGSPEASSELSSDHYFDHPGVAIVAQAGDIGYDDVEWPASIPGVVAVGGTSLKKDSGVPRGWTESVWGSSFTGSTSGTSSGCSKLESKPAWQTDPSCSKRTVADVAAVADPATGVAAYQSATGGWFVVGGTSVASPIVASAFAMATPAAPDAYPARYLYADPGDLFDVTSGANGTCAATYLCRAGVGYDGPSGLGTPDGVAAFGPPAASLTITPSKGHEETEVRISGSGFPTGDSVKISYDTELASPKTVTLCRATVATDGHFGCPAFIPSGNAGPLGRHRIIARDTTSAATAHLTTTFRLK